MHFENNFAVVLLDTNSEEFLSWLLANTVVLVEESLEDLLGDEDEVDSLSDALLHLEVLPLSLGRYVLNLVLFFGFEKVLE